MIINLDTQNLTKQDLAVLAALVNNDHRSPAPEPQEHETPKSAKKSAPAKAQKAEEPKAEVAEGGATLEDAVAAATKLVSQGKAAQVKAALNDVGAKRVSELNEDDIPAFLSALDGA